MKPIRVLVTGAGSGVGQGIIKALRLSTLPLTVLSSDITPLNAGLYRADEALLWPKVESEGALEIIVDSIRVNRADIVMIGSEFDLAFFAEHKETIEGETDTFVLVSPIETVRTADDKWLTVRFLQQNSFPCAEAALPESADEAIAIADGWSYPVVLKTRRGTSSRHVHFVEDAEQLRWLYDRVPDPMLQVAIGEPAIELANEYTTSVFAAKDGQHFGPFTARRSLRAGTSWHVEVDAFSSLYSVVEGIARRLTFLGSLNVQLIFSNTGPIPIEINSRFSGTTAIRAHFGFNEPEMAIRSYLLGEPISPPELRRGTALRYVEEVFLDDLTTDELGDRSLRGIIHQWF